MQVDNMKMVLPHSRKRAAALMVVLAAIVLLGLGVTAVVELTDHGAEVAYREAQRFDARMLAESGLALGLHPDVEPIDPVLHQEFEESDYRLDVKVTSEQGRVLINNVTEDWMVEGLQELFIAWGLDAERAATAAESLGDWVDSDDDASVSGAENSYYAGLGYEEYPRNEPFVSLEEMLLVRGMDEVAKIRPDWREFFTLYGDGKIAINAAPAEVIQAFAELHQTDAEKFVAARNGPDGKLGTEDDQLFSGGQDGNVQEGVELLGIPPNRLGEIRQRLTLDGTVLRVESKATVGDLEYTLVMLADRESGDSIARYEP